MRILDIQYAQGEGETDEAYAGELDAAVNGLHYKRAVDALTVKLGRVRDLLAVIETSEYASHDQKDFAVSLVREIRARL